MATSPCYSVNLPPDLDLLNTLLAQTLMMVFLVIEEYGVLFDRVLFLPSMLEKYLTIPGKFYALTLKLIFLSFKNRTQFYFLFDNSTDANSVH